ncbi:MAG: transketolase family protein, partial [Atopobiaceae bacterium]|nr:transketolase family protein [Atopobiaceae bacterium]
DLTIFVSGMLTADVVEAAKLLSAEGIDAEVINIHTIKPLDEELVVASARKTGRVVTVEEHSVIGGLGSAVCDALCAACPVPVKKVGIQDVFGESGPALDLLAKYGLDAAGVAGAVREFVR